MASPEQLKKADDLRGKAEALKVRYQQLLLDTDVLDDLMSHINAEYGRYLTQAMQQTDGDQALAALQYARACDNIRAYINQKLV